MPEDLCYAFDLPGVVDLLAVAAAAFVAAFLTGAVFEGTSVTVERRVRPAAAVASNALPFVLVIVEPGSATFAAPFFGGILRFYAFATCKTSQNGATLLRVIYGNL